MSALSEEEKRCRDKLIVGRCRDKLDQKIFDDAVKKSGYSYSYLYEMEQNGYRIVYLKDSQDGTKIDLIRFYS